MADPVWGLLAKAQDDPETITEAIAAAIAAHEADPTAHLGTGESLEQHRINGVIDHPQASVVGDKISNTEGMYFLPFESFDNYNVSSGGHYHSIGGMRFETGGTINTVKYINAPGQYGGNYYNVNKPVTFQFQAALVYNTSQIAYMLAGGDGIINEPPGIGFKVENGTLYACETVWGTVDFEEYTLEIEDIDITETHVYRVQVVPADNEAIFFIDGVQVATLELHTNDDVGLYVFSFYLKNTAASNRVIGIANVYYSVGPPI